MFKVLMLVIFAVVAEGNAFSIPVNGHDEALSHDIQLKDRFSTKIPMPLRIEEQQRSAPPVPPEPEIEVINKQKFPGVGNGIEGDYTLLLRVESDGEWDEAEFGLIVFLVDQAEVMANYSITMEAENDGASVQTKIAVAQQLGASNPEFIATEKLLAVPFWLKVEKLGNTVGISISKEQDDPKKFTSLSEVSLGKDYRAHWPMIVSSEGLTFSNADLKQAATSK